MLATVVGTIVLIGTMTGQEMDVSQMILIAVAIFEALLLLAAAYVSLLKVMQKPSADVESTFTIKPWQIAVLLVAAGLPSGWGA
jgi:hypothetical protein